MRQGPFEPGEVVLLHDRAGRRYPIRLQAGGTTSLHSGSISHDQLIGCEEGLVVSTSLGSRLLAVRPTFADRVLFFSRRAQPIYPKDLGSLLVAADIYPGAHVLEAGTGTGTLSAWLCRAVGPAGKVVSYELRPEFLEAARSAIVELLGDAPANLELRLGDVGSLDGEEIFDRVCLDLPQPWDAVPVVAHALRPGGIVFVLCPNLSQVQRFNEGLRAQGGFGLLETFEVLQRGWAVRERSLRPLHRMVAHTGFLTFARKLSTGATFETEYEGF